MKLYSTEFIKNYISEHKDDIASVDCGMREDWNWTHDTVFRNGTYLSDFDWNGNHIGIAGISGSEWATPVMRVEFKNGETKFVECYVNGGKQCTDSEIARMKSFSAETGGMDFLSEVTA